MRKETIEDKTYEVYEAEIVSTELGINAYGFFSTSLTFQFDGTIFATATGTRMDNGKEVDGREIVEIINIAGVELWENLPHSKILVLFEENNPDVLAGFASLDFEHYKIG